MCERRGLRTDLDTRLEDPTLSKVKQTGDAEEGKNTGRLTPTTPQGNHPLQQRGGMSHPPHVYSPDKPASGCFHHVWVIALEYKSQMVIYCQLQETRYTTYIVIRSYIIYNYIVYYKTQRMCAFGTKNLVTIHSKTLQRTERVSLVPYLSLLTYCKRSCNKFDLFTFNKVLSSFGKQTK